MTNRIRRHRRGLAATLSIAAAFALSGCANDSFAEQYAADAEQGYVAGDGSWEVFTPNERAEPVTYEGNIESGDLVSSADFAGEVVVMNFWYAACPPCRLEARDLEQVNQDYADQAVNFLGVNVYDQAPTAESFNAEFGVTYPSILDVDTASVRLAFSDNVPPQAIPSTLVIDQNGSVAAVIRGIADPSVLSEMIDTVLEEQAA